MTEENKHHQLSRREFLKDAGLIVGGATLSSMVLANACGGGNTVTVTQGTGAATTTTKTVTTTVGGGATVTVTSTATGTAPPTTAAANIVTLNVNSVDYTVLVQPWWPMSFVLREKLGLFGTKVGCEFGQCASCTILQDGTPVLSCLALAIESQGKKFQTIEGLSNGATMNALQTKMYNNEAFQCGYCTPGFIMAAQALLAATPKPTADQVREAISGHICMCQNFKHYVDAFTGGV